MNCITSITIALFISAAIAGEEVYSVVKQEGVGKNACGPCAYVNSMLKSNDEALLRSLEGESPEDKARNFGREFGSVPSVYSGKPETAYSEEDGVTDRDFLAMINKMRIGSGRAEVSDNYLLREIDETPTEFLRRIESVISKSIDSGFFPLLDLRRSKVALDDDGRMRWNKISGHWVCVVGVQFVADDLLIIRVADSDLGGVVSLVLHCDVLGEALTPMSLNYSDKGVLKWDWEKSGRCLTACSSILSVGKNKAKWFERSHLAACYIIVYDGLEQE